MVKQTYAAATELYSEPRSLNITERTLMNISVVIKSSVVKKTSSSCHKKHFRRVTEVFRTDTR